MEENKSKTKLADDLLLAALKIDSGIREGNPKKLESLFGTENTSIVTDKLRRLGTRHPSHRRMMDGIIANYEKQKRAPIIHKTASSPAGSSSVQDEFSRVVSDNLKNATPTDGIQIGSLLDVDITEAPVGTPLNEYVLAYLKECGYPGVPILERKVKVFEWNNQKWIPAAWNDIATLECKMVYEIDRGKKKIPYGTLRGAETIFRKIMGLNPLRAVSYYNFAIFLLRLFEAAKKEGKERVAISYLDEAWKQFEHTRARVELIRRLKKTDAALTELTQGIAAAMTYIRSHRKLFDGFILKRYLRAIWLFFFDASLTFSGKGARAAYDARSKEDLQKRRSKVEREALMNRTRRFRNPTKNENYRIRLKNQRLQLGHLMESKQYSSTIHENHLSEIKNFLDDEMMSTIETGDETKISYTYVHAALYPHPESGRITFTSNEAKRFYEIVTDERKNNFGVSVLQQDHEAIFRFTRANHAILFAIRVQESLKKERNNSKDFQCLAVVKLEIGIVRGGALRDIKGRIFPTATLPKKRIEPGKIVISRKILDALDEKIGTHFRSFHELEPEAGTISSLEEQSFSDTAENEIELFEYTTVFNV